jgi:glyoxylase-like metal-dependent hydrolase (beta-lactamase superfamily II)
VSGEATFTLRQELYVMRVGSGIVTSVAARTMPTAEERADEERRLKRKYELLMRDVKGFLETLVDDGVPLLPHDDTLPVVVHPGIPVHKARLRFEGTSPTTGESWRLDVVVDRPLSDAVLRAIEDGVVRAMWPPPPAVKRVHHLNCLTMCPLASGLLNDHGHLVCHCLLLETEQGLVLVDTALGTEAIMHPPKHASRMFLGALRPKMDVDQTAVRQIQKLGFRTDDVTHVILTHLDLDHAGGLPDFPKATVHVMAGEHAAAHTPQSFFEKERYKSSQWAHDVKWALHETKGERWYGFECVRDLPGLPPEILMVPLVGHTRGHAGVAVDVGGRWMLHCGDAYFHKDEMDYAAPSCSPGLAGFQRFVAIDDVARRKNQARLRELAHGVGEGISLFCAHDPDDLERMRAEQLPST